MIYYFFQKAIFNELINERKKLLEEILHIIIIDECNSQNKGKIFEDLACNLLRSPYLEFHSRDKRTPTGEIDLTFSVYKIPATLFNNFSDILIAECKNWNSNADAPSMRTFISKMEDVRSNVGVFFTKKGITGDYSNSTDGKGVIKNKWLEKKLMVLEFDLGDVKDVIIPLF